ncbi:hypothetical protein JQ616_18055 [Bradyrhizobium tropiciagri]|uniref:hypothetical protein n=1 Tax=Bradyrhizobium tropiciagri TaxID=312253 RepID=UPI001BA9FEE3|nr:hypothetical protein [Bradyrhizobium tropiciagri]MBR0896868.1 hypothetical protein [Bradyrhizobium tropiciagri]
MVDKARQLVARVDLYGNYLVSMALVVSLCEFPFLAWRLDLARLILPLGWAAMLVLGIKRMWTIKVEHQLTAELQLGRIIAGIAIAALCSTWMYHVVADIGMVRTDRLIDIGQLVLVVNGVAGLGVYTAGAVLVWLFSALSSDDS